MSIQEREKIISVAKTWIGTPFHDNCGLKGVGTDCAHFLARVYEESGFSERVDIEYYSPQFFMHTDEEKFASYVLKYAKEIEEKNAGPGDAVLYKIGRSYAHGAIIVDWPSRIIHAHKLTGCVIESSSTDADLRGRKTRFFSIW